MPDTARRNLSDELLTQVVLESFENAQSPRIKEVLQSLVKHLHAFARRRAAHRGGVGLRDRLPDPHGPHHRRQAPGVHPAVRRARPVDAGHRHQPRRCRTARTETTVFGPFFVDDSPAVHQSATTSPTAPRASRATSTATCAPATASRSPGAELEVWMADDEGNYDVQYADLDHAAGPRPLCAPRTTALLVLVGAARGLPDPARRPGRRPAQGRRPPPVASRAHPLPDQRARLQDVHHARLRRRRPVPGLRRRLRREELAHRRASSTTAPGTAHARRPRHRRPRVDWRPLRLRPGSGGRASDGAGDGRPDRRQRPRRRRRGAGPEHATASTTSSSPSTAGPRTRRARTSPTSARWRSCATSASRPDVLREGDAARADGRDVVLHEPGRRGARPRPAHLGHAPRARGRLHARQPVAALSTSRRPTWSRSSSATPPSAARGSRFDTEYLSPRAGRRRRHATVRDRRTGHEYTIRAKYLIGADGGRSQVAEDIGLPFEGADGLGGLDEHRVRRRPRRTSSSTGRASCTGCCSRAPTSAASALGLVRMVRPWNEWLIVWGYDINEPPPDVDDEAATEIVAQPRRRRRRSRSTITSTSLWGNNKMYATELHAAAGCSAWATPCHRHPPSQRPRLQHLDPGRLQPRLEARARAAGQGGAERCSTPTTPSARRSASRSCCGPTRASRSSARSSTRSACSTRATRTSMQAHIEARKDDTPEARRAAAQAARGDRAQELRVQRARRRDEPALRVRRGREPTARRSRSSPATPSCTTTRRPGRARACRTSGWARPAARSRPTTSRARAGSACSPASAARRGPTRRKAVTASTGVEIAAYVIGPGREYSTPTTTGRAPGRSRSRARCSCVPTAWSRGARTRSPTIRRPRSARRWDSSWASPRRSPPPSLHGGFTTGGGDDGLGRDRGAGDGAAGSGGCRRRAGRRRGRRRWRRRAPRRPVQPLARRRGGPAGEGAGARRHRPQGRLLVLGAAQRADDRARHRGPRGGLPALLRAAVAAGVLRPRQPDAGPQRVGARRRSARSTRAPRRPRSCWPSAARCPTATARRSPTTGRSCPRTRPRPAACSCRSTPASRCPTAG